MKNIVLSLLLTGLCISAVLPPAAQARTLTFSAALSGALDSKHAAPGQAVQARLLSNLTDGGKVIAPAGSHLYGKVTEVDHARRTIKSDISPKRWLRASGGVGIEFNRVVTPGGKSIALHAIPQAIVGGNKSLVANKNGVVQESRKKELKPKAARTALGVAAFVGAPFTPIIGGIAGAVRPSTVLAEDTNGGGEAHKHRHLKGMATGFVAGIPGGFLINDSVLKGRDVILPAGTRLKLQADL